MKVKTLAGFVGFLSCNKLENSDSRQGAVEFATSTVTKTLVESEEDASFKSRGIGLFGSDASGNVVFADNTPLTFSSTKWDYASQNVSKIYWADSDSYSFAAVWPYSATDAISSNSVSYNHSTGVLDIDCSSGVSKSTADLMYDNVVELKSAHAINGNDGKPVSYSPVSLSMKHAFAALQFKVVNASGGAIEKVGGPNLTGIEYKGTGQVPPSSQIVWKLSGEKNTLSDTGYQNSGKTFDMASSSTTVDFYDDWLVVLPQPVGGTDIKFSFSYGPVGARKNVACFLKDATGIPRWEPGKKYVYTMTITSASITFTVTVKDWITHEYDI